MNGLVYQELERTAYYDYPLEDGRYLRCSIFYSLGGYNYFNGNYNRRGYYLNFKPIEKADGFISFSMLGDNNDKIKSYKILIKPVNRFSKKVFDKLISNYDFEQLCKEWIENYRACADKYMFKAN